MTRPLYVFVSFRNHLYTENVEVRIQIRQTFLLIFEIFVVIHINSCNYMGTPDCNNLLPEIVEIRQVNGDKVQYRQLL